MSQPANGTGKWQMISVAAGAVFAVAGSFITMQTQVGQLNSQLTSQYEKIRTLEDLARRSIDDRSAMRSDFEAQRRLVDGKFAEIETQFSAMNSFMNVEVAQRRQFDGVFFQKMFGQDLPNNMFYPTLHHELQQQPVPTR